MKIKNTLGLILFFIAISFVPSLAEVLDPASISGVITTNDGLAAPYVNIFIKDLNRGTTTDENGFFLLKGLKAGTFILSASYTGFKVQEKEVTLQNGITTKVNITLSENSTQLKEVVINGAKINRPVSFGKSNLRALDVPQSMGIISNQVIQDQQVNRLGDVLKNISGVSLTQQRQGVAETFSARGYSIGIAGSGGSIFKNGIMSNTQGFPEASTLESIEVLKGSSAMLYGNTSGGLVINMVTKKPKFDFGGEVSMRVGSYEFYKPTVDIYGPITKNLAFRVIGTHEDAKSFRDVVATKRTYVNPSLLYKLGSKTTVLVQGDYLKSNFTPDNGIGIINQNQDAQIIPSRSRFINTSWAWYHLNQFSASANVDHQFNSNWKLNFVAAAQGTDVNAFGTGVPNAVATNGDWSRTLSRTKTGEDSYTGQLNLNGKFHTGKVKHQVLVGTDAVKVITESNTFNITSNGVVVSTYDKINIIDMSLYQQREDIPDVERKALTTSPAYRLGYYAQDLISLTDKFKVLAGIRWSYQKTQKSEVKDYIANTTTKGTTTVSNKAWSPKVALMYQPISTTSVYASYSNNFTANSGTDVYGTSISPSLVDQYEVGAKNEFLGGKLSANVSIYRIQNKDFWAQAYFEKDGVTINSSNTVKERTGETTSDGFELDVNAQLSKNLYFLAGYGYNYMRYTKTTGLKYSPVLKERLINNPAHTANASIFYTLPEGQLKGLKLGFAGFYTGKRNGGLNNTVEQTPDYDRLVHLTGFATFDVSAGYNFKQFSLLAKVSNITNELNYLAHDRYSINPIAPRQFMTTLSYKF